MNDHFACLTETGFAALMLWDLLESVVAYEDVESQNLPLPRIDSTLKSTLGSKSSICVQCIQR